MKLLRIDLRNKKAPKALCLGAVKRIYNGKVFLTSEQVGILFTLQRTGALPKTFQALAYRTTLGTGKHFIPCSSISAWLKINRVEIVEESTE